MDTQNFDKESITKEIDSIIAKIQDESTSAEDREKYLEFLKMIKHMGDELKDKLKK